MHIFSTIFPVYLLILRVILIFRRRAQTRNIHGPVRQPRPEPPGAHLMHDERPDERHARAARVQVHAFPVVLLELRVLRLVHEDELLYLDKRKRKCK